LRPATIGSALQAGALCVLSGREYIMYYGWPEEPY
jgi:hypothetical protein